MTASSLPPVHIRAAAAEDIAFIAQLSRLDRDVIQQQMLAHGTLLVAEIEQDAAGFLWSTYLWTHVPYLQFIFVKEGFRNRGCGKALLSSLEHSLRSEGQRFLYSSSEVTATAAQGWHRRMGFQECGIIAGVNEDGVGEVFFRKKIAKNG